MKPKSGGKLCTQKHIFKILVFSVLFAVLLFVANGLTRLGSRTNTSSSRYKRKFYLNRLVSWAQGNRALFPPSVTLAEVSDIVGWGVVSTRRISKGEIVCALPKSLIINPEGEGSVIFSLAKILLRNKSTSAYSASLPWDDGVQSDIASYEQSIRDALDATDEAWDKRSFRTAVSLVLSRIHLVDGNQMALVPLCDMFNTDSTGNDFNVFCTTAELSNDSNHTSDYFSCVANKDIPAGHQLLVHYRDTSGNIVSKDQLRSQWGINEM